MQGRTATSSHHPTELYMFYNELNLESLAKVFPFEEDDLAPEASLKHKTAYLRTKAVPISCTGWVQVFTEKHISIEPSNDEDPVLNTINCFGLRLNAKQATVVEYVLRVPGLYTMQQVLVQIYPERKKALAYAAVLDPEIVF